jgi:phospholipid-binding lipoprotein MlaA
MFQSGMKCCKGLLIFVFSAFFLSACQTMPPDPANPPDPLEHLNQDGFRFNNKIDDTVLKPLAKGYNSTLPYFMRQGITNFFANYDSIPGIGDDILQGDVRWTLNDMWRVAINSTIGIGGLFDVATRMGLNPHYNDFGLTLNAWHIYTPYFIVPVLGPKTIGGVIGIIPDYYMGIGAYTIPTQYSLGLTAMDGLNSRAGLIGGQNAASGFVLDPYIFLRNAYLQNREHELLLNQQGPYYPGYDVEATTPAPSN